VEPQGAFVASGVWSQEEQYANVLDGTWI
jgi:hypothetical protein